MISLNGIWDLVWKCKEKGGEGPGQREWWEGEDKDHTEENGGNWGTRWELTEPAWPAQVGLTCAEGARLSLPSQISSPPVDGATKAVALEKGVSAAQVICENQDRFSQKGLNCQVHPKIMSRALYVPFLHMEVLLEWLHVLKGHSVPYKYVTNISHVNAPLF